MTEVISVKFKEGGRAYYFDPDGNTVNIGDSVIVGTQNGNEFGTVSEANHSVDDGAIVKPLRKMLRKATERDFKRLEENKKKQAETFKLCEELIISHKLLDLIVEYGFSKFFSTLVLCIFIVIKNRFTYVVPSVHVRDPVGSHTWSECFTYVEREHASYKIY